MIRDGWQHRALLKLKNLFGAMAVPHSSPPQQLFQPVGEKEEKYHSIVVKIVTGQDIDQVEADFVYENDPGHGKYEELIKDAIKAGNIANFNRVIRDMAGDRLREYEYDSGFSSSDSCSWLEYAINAGAEQIALALVANPYTDVTERGEHHALGIFYSSSRQSLPVKELAYKKGMQSVVEAIDNRIDHGPPPERWEPPPTSTSRIQKTPRLL